MTGFTPLTIIPARASCPQADHAGERQELAPGLHLPLRAIGAGADQPARLWRRDVSHLRARHRRHRCQDLPRALDLYLAAEGAGDLDRQPRRRDQGRPPGARHGRRLSHRPRHVRRLAVVEPADRERSGGQYFSMPPLIYGDLIIAGPSGADFGAKNWVGAFKLETGEPVWKFNLIPDPGEPGAESWPMAESLEAWRRQPLDAALARRQGRYRLSAGRQSCARFLRRAQARRQPLHQLARRARCQDGQASLVSPVHPPRRA